MGSEMCIRDRPMAEMATPPSASALPVRKPLLVNPFSVCLMAVPLPGSVPCAVPLTCPHPVGDCGHHGGKRNDGHPRKGRIFAETAPRGIRRFGGCRALFLVRSENEGGRRDRGRPRKRSRVALVARGGSRGVPKKRRRSGRRANRKRCWIPRASAEAPGDRRRLPCGTGGRGAS